jgi:hypothetical protein
LPVHLLVVQTNHSLLTPNEAFTRCYDMKKFVQTGGIEL